MSALAGTNLLATPPDESFDRITRLTAKLLDVPVALVSLVGADHQFFKSCIGLPEPWSSERRTPLSHSFCQHVVATETLLSVRDARVDPVLRGNLAIRDLGVIAYLGAPLKTPDGHTIGSLCAIDSTPRDWTEEQHRTITDLAAFVATQIEVRQAAADAEIAGQMLQAARIESEQETRVRLLADAMPQIVWTANSAGDVRYFNQRWFDYTGMNFEQTKDWGWKPVLHPDDLDRCVAEWTTAVRTGTPQVGEYRFRRGRDGAFRWHLSRSLPSRDATGRIVEWVGTSTDVHDFKTAQAELERSHEQLEQRVEQRTEQLRREHRFSEAVLHNITDGIVACDRSGRITYLNPALCKMAGLDGAPTGELNSSWASEHLRIYDPGTGRPLPWDERPLARAVRGETVDRVELLIKPAAGPDRSILVSVRAMTDAAGEIIGAVSAWHDFTELRRSQGELLAETRRADAANAAKSDFLANMSHEIRTPITAILGFSDLLQDAVLEQIWS